MRRTGCFLLILFALAPARAQQGFHHFLTPEDTLDRKRVHFIEGTWTGIYGTALIGLNSLWYAQYPRSAFHFYNDDGEWNQMDKCGHVLTAYFEAQWSTQVLQWAGISKNKAAWYGAATGILFQSIIETLDGFSTQWGFSPGDMTANVLGSGICLSQHLLWQEQRIQLRFSSHPVSYPAEVKSRALDLYGRSIPEKVLKDYNGQTYWLDVNPFSFMKKSHPHFPAWLNISMGYGSEYMLGGYRNQWTDEAGNAEQPPASYPARTRQFFLSADLDLTRIKTKSRVLKTLFSMVNVLKIPAPALEWNTLGKFVLHPVYF